jgi:nucleoside 2-deoxyribosyltransferase
MKFFVSGKVGDDNITKTVMKALKNAGHEITFDWTTIEHLRPYDENATACRDAAVSESRGVKNADVLVIIAHNKGIGMYVELGIAIGLGIPIRVVTKVESQTMFFHHPLVKKVSDIDEVIKEFS